MQFKIKIIFSKNGRLEKWQTRNSTEKCELNIEVLVYIRHKKRTQYIHMKMSEKSVCEKCLSLHSLANFRLLSDKCPFITLLQRRQILLPDTGVIYYLCLYQ